ncbi:restriction endonuclease subunit S [Brochothrix thermosphacta]|uniref:restriction endonuclease subunit S n=1 Tax=Brochothrix thermosphacta TaxID=2756 RepID=UPI00083FD79E|nr:restriction endonuclease subunit S [Brochothrix thermosphacta]ODJ70259.1 hypothetical protein BFR43_08400 [Brochothrix thermosphacta]
MEHKKIPEIRFSGFTNEWEERKLGDLSKVIDPHPSHRAPAATEVGIPFIGIGDVDEVGNINYKTARIVDEKIFEEHHNRYNLAITSIGIGRVASLGKVIRLRDDIGKYAVSPTMSVIQFTNNNDLDFLYSNMNTPIFQKQFKSFSNGSTRQSVGIQDLRTLMVSLPIDIEEQKKIGLLFKQLDDTIALHQRKLELLKEQKKGFLQKMFPKNGETVPELRFSGFTNEWEERKLGDLSKVIDPHPSHRAPAATEVGIPFIGIGDVDEVGNINYKTARIVDEKIFEEHHNRYNLAITSIGIGRVASLGKVIRLRDDIGKYAVSPTMSVIQFTNNNDLDFLYSNMNTPIFQKQFKSFSNGSTRQSVGIQDLRTLMVSLPIDIEEQKKIGLLFKQLDDTIALHQRKLELLKEQKKGFLQKMFPKNS